MPLLRVFTNAGSQTTAGLKHMIRYVVSGKSVWEGVNYACETGFIRGYAVAIGSVEQIYSSLYLLFYTRGFPGKRLFYHVLLDFNGMLSVKDTGEISWQINKSFLEPQGLPFIQGVHVTKGKQAMGTLKYAPHVHVLISTIPVTSGKKFHMTKEVIKCYKDAANLVLLKWGLPQIKIYQIGDGNDVISDSRGIMG